MFKIQKLDLLIAFYTTSVVLTELMGAKTVPLFSVFGIPVSGTVTLLVLPFIYSVNDIIVEVYGKPRAQSIVRSTLLMVLYIFIFSVIATILPADHRFAPTENAYETVFGISARFSAASLIAFALSEFSDVYIFAKMRERLGKRNLWLRTNVSNFASEFLDTAIFMTLAFYALNLPVVANLTFIAGIAIPYWLLRCVMSIIETPLVYVGVKWLGKPLGAKK
jgi:queuosine precursor transporter